MEQLIHLTNCEDFIDNFAFYIVGASLVPKTDTMILTLEAYYDGFEENRLDEKQKWQVKCDGYFNQKIEIGYLRPFYRIKILKDHPLLWNYGPESHFSITGSSNKIPELMGELFIVHTHACGNWVNFHNLFGFLPEILNAPSDNQLVVPEPLLDNYLKIFQKHDVPYFLNSYQKNRVELSALLFTSLDYSDNYSYGQPYIVAKSFEATKCA